MDDASLVRGFDCFRNMQRDIQRFFRGNRTALDAFFECFAFNQFQDKEA